MYIKGNLYKVHTNTDIAKSKLHYIHTCISAETLLTILPSTVNLDFSAFAKFCKKDIYDLYVLFHSSKD